MTDKKSDTAGLPSDCAGLDIKAFTERLCDALGPEWREWPEHRRGKEFVRLEEAIRVALPIAALSRATEAVAVKPLKWGGSGNGVLYAEIYTIQEGNKSEYHRFKLTNALRYAESYGTLEDAKAAAQADYERRVRAALSEQGEAAQPAADWLTMDSAPKDGTRVDLWVKPWDAEANGNPARITDAWFADGRWWRWLAGWQHDISDCGVPTRWMPLPASPGIASQAEEGSGE